MFVTTFSQKNEARTYYLEVQTTVFSSKFKLEFLGQELHQYYKKYTVADYIQSSRKTKDHWIQVALKKIFMQD